MDGSLALTNHGKGYITSIMGMCREYGTHEGDSTPLQRMQGLLSGEQYLGARKRPGYPIFRQHIPF
jgi:hypothetical protein